MPNAGDTKDLFMLKDLPERNALLQCRRVFIPSFLGVGFNRHLLNCFGGPTYDAYTILT